MTHRPAPTDLPKRDPIESLEVQLENAWCRITDLRGGQRFFAYLSPQGRLFLRAEPLEDPLGALVGAGEGWAACTRLVDFRAAVFAAFETLRRHR